MAKLTKEQQDEIARILATPVGFAAQVLGLKMYDWQFAGMNAVCAPLGRNRTAICAPNGSGKSERVVAASVLYWLTVHPRGKVVVTTADGKQLDGQIIPAIWAHRARFPAWRFVEREITTPTGGFAKFWTTDEPGRAEGWHGKEGAEEPLLIIVDEAKSVPEKIFEALDRCTFQSILYISSPGLMEGRFYDAFTRRYSTQPVMPHFLPSLLARLPFPSVPKVLNDFAVEFLAHPYARNAALRVRSQSAFATGLRLPLLFSCG